MKKIILTGVVLLLLIIIAADIYNDHNRTNDKNKVQAANGTPGNSAPGATPAITSGNGNVSYSGDITQPSVSRNYKHIRARHRQGTIVDNYALAANTPSGEGDLDEENDVPDIGAEISKSFYGNIPQAQASEQPEKREAVIAARQPVVTDHRSNVHFGPEIGIMQNCLSNENTPNMSRIGFRAGAIADIGMGDHFALQPGLMYALKGIEVENISSTAINSTSTMEVDTKDKINLNYIELPVDLVVKFGDWHDGRFMIGAGPYIAYLASVQNQFQTTQTITTSSSQTTSASSETAATARTTEILPVNEYAGHPELSNSPYPPIPNNMPGNTTMRTLDWGVNGFVGCEMPGGLFAKAGTDVGMINIQRNADGSYTNRNYNFFISLGYLIGYKR